MAAATDIANQALERIGVKSTDHAATAEDAAKAQQVLTNLHEVFVARDYVDFELASTPAWAVGPMVAELAWRLKTDFELPGDKVAKLQIEQQEARSELLAMTATQYNGEPVKADYF